VAPGTRKGRSARAAVDGQPALATRDLRERQWRHARRLPIVQGESQCRCAEHARRLPGIDVSSSASRAARPRANRPARSFARSSASGRSGRGSTSPARSRMRSWRGIRRAGYLGRSRPEGAGRSHAACKARSSPFSSRKRSRASPCRVGMIARRPPPVPRAACGASRLHAQGVTGRGVRAAVLIEASRDVNCGPLPNASGSRCLPPGSPRWRGVRRLDYRLPRPPRRSPRGRAVEGRWGGT
jgi:hypothetical protein